MDAHGASFKNAPGEAALESWANLAAQLNIALGSGEGGPSDSLRGALQQAARRLGVPVDTPRDDAHVFLADTAKLSTATWTQCGGVLRALLKHEVQAKPDAWLGAVERLAVLAPTHR